MNLVGRRLIIVSAAILLLSIGLAACGDDEPEPTATQAPAGPSGDIAAGRALWETQCQICHSIDGSPGLGPTLQGLWMSEVPLTDGTTVTADEEYISESITQPTTKIREGFGPTMPPMNLNNQQIDNLVAFIASLD